MYKGLNKGEIQHSVNLIPPSEIKNLEQDQLILVNRVRLNSRLLEFELNNITEEYVIIARKALHNMKQKEMVDRQISMGAEMRVSEVCKVFKNIESMPKNSFAYVKI